MRSDDPSDAHFVQTLKDRFVGRMFGTRPAIHAGNTAADIETPAAAPTPRPEPVEQIAPPPPPPKRPFGSVDREQRKRTERAASATRAQRAAIARQQAAPRRDKMVNLRTTEERFLEIKAMAARANMSVTAMLERGLVLFAEELDRRDEGPPP